MAHLCSTSPTSSLACLSRPSWRAKPPSGRYIVTSKNCSSSGNTLRACFVRFARYIIKTQNTCTRQSAWSPTTLQDIRDQNVPARVGVICITPHTKIVCFIELPSFLASIYRSHAVRDATGVDLWACNANAIAYITPGASKFLASLPTLAMQCIFARSRRH